MHGLGSHRNGRLRTRHTSSPSFLDPGHHAVVEALLEGGADPDAKNKSGVSPLATAACKGHLEAVDALLCAGALPNYTPDTGKQKGKKKAKKNKKDDAKRPLQA